MGIGVTVGRDAKPTITGKLATPGVVVLDWIEASGVVPVIQGSDMAVAPQGDTSTGLLAPPIPGGLQMEKVIIVSEAQPINVDLPAVLGAWRRLHLFLNFTMPMEGYLEWPTP